MPLLGEGRTLEISDKGRIRSEAPIRPAARPLPPSGERQPLQRSDDRRAERADDPQSVEQLGTLGPQAGNVQPRETSRELSGSTSQSTRPEPLPGQALARRELTQAGLVEAQQSRDLFARFLAGTPRRDPGPEPRPREFLGIPSRPISLEV